MPTTEITQSVSGDPHFRRLWVGYSVSAAGSAVGGTALPVVAVRDLHAGPLAVSVLAASGSTAALVLALPVGRWAEFRRKRPAMILSDVIRCLGLLSVPLAAVYGRLSLLQLCVVAAVVAVGEVLFSAAAQAQLIDLVSRARIVDANGRLSASTWLSLSVGPAVGGVIITAVGAVSTVLVDALSYLASAITIRLIRKPETPPSGQPVARDGGQVLFGLRFLLADPQLRRLASSWMVFAGSAALATPLASVFYLRQLHFSTWQYGLIMGVPALAGFAGSRLTRRVVARWGALVTVRRTSLLRALPMLLTPLAGRGWVGVLLCGMAFAGLLFFSSLSNSALTGYRQLRTPDGLLVRVATSWSFAQRLAQSCVILAGGALTEVIGLRAGLFGAAGGALVAALLVPRTGPAD